MPAKTRPPGMWDVLKAIDDDDVYAAFLRGRFQAGDNSFLLMAIRRGNLRAPERKVLEELVTRKLRRPKQRPPSDETDIRNASRALYVLDLEAAGWNKRDAAIEEAKGHLRCGRRTIEKALSEFEPMLKGADKGLLDGLRSAFKSPLTGGGLN